MASIQLEPYIFCFSKKNKKDDPFSLSNIDSNGNSYSALKIFLDFFNEREQHPFIEQQESNYLKVDFFKTGANYLSSQLLRGEYGEEADIVNINTDLNVYTKMPDEALLNLFYFHCHVPDPNPVHKYGFLLFQKTGIHGIKTLFTDDFTKYLNNNFSDLSIDIESVMSRDLFEQLFNNSSIRELIITQYGIPQDIADNYSIGVVPEKTLYEIRLRAGRGEEFRHLKTKLQNTLFSGGKLSSLFSPKFISPNHYKIRTTIGDKQRTFDLGDLNLPNATLDVSSIIQYGDNGLPLFESIDEQAVAFSKDLISLLGYGE